MIERKVTCDNCQKVMIVESHGSAVQIPNCYLGFRGMDYQFCDLNCVESWLMTRHRQKQGDRMAITTIAHGAS